MKSTLIDEYKNQSIELCEIFSLFGESITQEEMSEIAKITPISEFYSLITELFFFKNNLDPVYSYSDLKDEKIIFYIKEMISVHTFEGIIEEKKQEIGAHLNRLFSYLHSLENSFYQNYKSYFLEYYSCFSNIDDITILEDVTMHNYQKGNLLNIFSSFFFCFKDPASRKDKFKNIENYFSFIKILDKNNINYVEIALNGKFNQIHAFQQLFLINIFNYEKEVCKYLESLNNNLKKIGSSLDIEFKKKRINILKFHSSIFNLIMDISLKDNYSLVAYALRCEVPTGSSNDSCYAINKNHTLSLNILKEKETINASLINEENNTTQRKRI